jgi:hypothetical protein
MISDGLVRRDGADLRTTRRWQAAMMRAAARLVELERDGGDLRLPIAAALVEIYRELGDDEIVEAIAAILPIELAELARSTPTR